MVGFFLYPDHTYKRELIFQNIEKCLYNYNHKVNKAVWKNPMFNALTWRLVENGNFMKMVESSEKLVSKAEIILANAKYNLDKESILENDLAPKLYYKP